ncbi:MAG: EAL domain-containing protein [Gammaproteobacteria bacterium]|nr:EAL domain-containing protein [Gammaproteobacteria bacterium]
MTLRRFLSITVLVVCATAFVSALAVNVRSARQFLEFELAAHAQGAANSLALSLTPGMVNNDQALMESVINAAFDPVLHREISVVTPAGATLISRTHTEGIEGVPDWYVRLVPLDVSIGEAKITSAQERAARVYVRGNTSHAYAVLWRSALQNFAWCFGVGVVLLMVAMVVSRRYLKQIRNLVEHADAIGRGELSKLERLPRTSELRPLATSLDKTGAAVEDLLAEQTDRARRWEREAHTDAFTGLLDRRGLQANIQERCAREHSRGVFFLIEFYGMGSVASAELSGRDEFLHSVVKQLDDCCETLEDIVSARLGDWVFAICAFSMRAKDTGALASRFVEILSQLCDRNQTTDRVCGIHVGVSDDQVLSDVKAPIAQAEAALSLARSKGSSGWASYEDWRTYSPDPNEIHHLSDVLEDAIQGHKIALRFQPVISSHAPEPCHYEVLSRLPMGRGELLPAKAFLPAAYRAGLGARIDKVVVESAAAHLAMHPRARYALNLSPAVLRGDDFIDWLTGFLSGLPGVAQRLMFEVPESTLHTRVSKAAALRDRFSTIGCGFGVDHFGISNLHFGYLASLRPNYIKVDRRYTCALDRNQQDQLYLSAISDVAHRLDIEVIATALETGEAWKMACHLGVDAGQGYLLGRPQHGLMPTQKVAYA